MFVCFCACERTWMQTLRYLCVGVCMHVCVSSSQVVFMSRFIGCDVNLQKNRRSLWSSKVRRGLLVLTQASAA